MPPGCKPFSFQNGVCVGDLIAILACGISGFGFLLWAIHAIHKMRYGFIFNWKEGDQPIVVVDPPFYVPSANDNSILSHGIRKTPNICDRSPYLLKRTARELYGRWRCLVNPYLRVDSPRGPPLTTHAVLYRSCVLDLLVITRISTSGMPRELGAC